MKNIRNLSKRLLVFVTICSLFISLVPTVAFAESTATATTNEVDEKDVKSTSAYVSGTATISDADKFIKKGFYYYAETEEPYVPAVSQRIVEAQSDDYGYTLTDLRPSTKYYVYAFIEYYTGYAEFGQPIQRKYGEEKSFTTKADATQNGSVSVPTYEINSSTEATFSSTYTAVGYTIKTAGFVYSVDTDMPVLNGSGVSAVEASASAPFGTITKKIADINRYSPSWVRGYIVVEDPSGLEPNSKVIYSDPVVYTPTQDSKLLVSTDYVSCNGNYIEAEGSIFSPNYLSVTERGFVYSAKNSSPTLSDSVVVCHSTDNHFSDSFYVSRYDGDRYYVRAYATNSFGTSYGATESVYTDFDYNGTGRSTVYTDSVSHVVSDGAEISIHVSDRGDSYVTERGVVYSSVNSTPTLYGADNDYRTASGTTGSTTITLTGLRSGTKYYVRAYVKNDSGTSYGSTDSFITTGYYDGYNYDKYGYGYYNSGVQTVDVRSIMPTSAVAYGYAGGNSNSYTVTERGFVYSTTNLTPTLSDTKVSDLSGGIGDYTVSLTNLSKNTKYYIRAFTRTTQGISYGSTLNFTTYAIGSANVRLSNF